MRWCGNAGLLCSPRRDGMDTQSGSAGLMRIIGSRRGTNRPISAPRVWVSRRCCLLSLPPLLPSPRARFPLPYLARHPPDVSLLRPVIRFKPNRPPFQRSASSLFYLPHCALRCPLFPRLRRGSRRTRCVLLLLFSQSHGRGKGPNR